MRAIILIFAALVCISCSDTTKTSLDTQAVPEAPVTPVEPDTPEVPETPEAVINFVPDNNTPYATIEELEVLSSNPENVHYKVARVIVLQEVLSDEVNKYDKSFALSYTPVIIHGLDGRAQYYEYRLTKDGNAYRSYAVMVLKHQAVGVVTRQDLASDYSANKKGMKVVAPIYPSRYGLANTISHSRNRNSIINQKFYIPGMDEEVGLADLLEGTEIGEKLNEPSTRGVVDENLVDLLVADMDDPKFWSAMKTSSTQFSQMRNAEGGDNMTQQINESYNEKKQLNIEEFKSMDAEMQRVISLSQEEAEKQLVEAKEAEDKLTPPSTRASWVPRARTHAYKVFPYQGMHGYYWKTIRELGGSLACGPGAIAMIMYAYYYKTYTLDKNYFANILWWANYYNKSGGDRAKSMVHWEFDNFFERYGQDLQFGNGFIWRNNIAAKAFRHIQSGSPILFLTWGHWLIGFESIYYTKTYRWWIFSSTWHQRNFRMTDNGYKGKHHTDYTFWWGDNHPLLFWMHPVVLR